jgi:adenine-specific DNA-methyltransferase
MTYEQIHNLFKKRYNQNNWKQFLSEAFANTRMLAKPEILTGIDSNVASQVQKLGYITLNENGFDRHIAVYEVTLAQGIVLERNRVGLRNLLRKYWRDIDAAFIAYHRPESLKWRFTYVSELTGYNADGESVKIKTEPKRYTYVLGEGESTRTAAERFTTIANKGSSRTWTIVRK